MHAEIIAVGSELTTGAKLDTNSQWLSLALAERGIPTHFHTTVADELPAMVQVLRNAVHRSDVVIISGGLGPTLDDLTRQALAELVQRDLVLHEPSLRHIEEMFACRNRPMAPRNRIQAMFPAGSEPIRNPRGTAPGIWMEVPRKGRDDACIVVAVPGVPSEMKRMFAAEVEQRLPVGNAVIRRARVNCFGIGESNAEELLGELTARGRDPEVGITAHEATITLRITAHGATADECAAKIDAARKEIRARLGSLVFGDEDDELEHVVLRQLDSAGKTLATAESGTGGLLAYRLSEVGEHRRGFVGGLVAASERQLLASLDWINDEESGMKDVTIPHPPFDRRHLAERIAAATRDRFRSDYALAVLDCPDFNPDAGEVAPDTFVALATPTGARSDSVTLFGDPAIQKSRTAKAALNLLRLELPAAPMQ
jgi:competence/damage-inducible protein CinA-like protein